MPRKGKKRKKGGQKKSAQKKHVNKAAQPKQASAPREPEPVDPQVVEMLGELQADYDIAIKLGHAYLGDDKIDQAVEQEQIARAKLRASKKLSGVQPIAPGPVRTLAREIRDYESNVAAARSKRIHQLTSVADQLLEEIRQTANIRSFGGFTLVGGNLVAALQLIDEADPDIIESRSVQFAELMQLITQTKHENDERISTRLHGDLCRLQLQDTTVALAIVDELERDFPGFYNIDELRASVESTRSLAEKYQEKQAQAAAARKAKQDEEDRKRQEERAKAERYHAACDAYEKIVGSRHNKIKPGQALRNLRDAHRRDPQGLKTMMETARGTYTTYESEVARLELIKKNAQKTWMGYQELEWLEAAKTGEQMLARLIEACQRDHLDWIRDRGDWYKRMLEVFFDHRELIYLKVLELLKKDCPECLKVARWLANLAFDDGPCSFRLYYYYPQTEGVEQVDLDDAFDKAERREKKICSKKEHAPKREPWNRRNNGKREKATSK